MYTVVKKQNCTLYTQINVQFFLLAAENHSITTQGTPVMQRSGGLEEV
jgi:hypothetical protein